MAEAPKGSTAAGAGGRAPRRGRNLVPTLIGLALAALVGGVVGGLIVWATTDSGNGSTSSATVSNGTVAACPAANVADQALPSIVTVVAGANGAGG
jgi:putative serine protease PepD